MKLLKPKAIKRGDLIGVIAPASAPVSQEKIDKGAEYLERLGYRVKLGKNVFGGGISVALNINSSSDGNIAVLGEVRNPGRYTIGNPVSPFFALAMAGGALDTGKKSQVVVVKRQPDGHVGWHVVNLDLDSSAPLGPEIALAPQDMLLVPKSGIANLNRFVEQYLWRMTPLPASMYYSLNPLLGPQ